MNKTLEKVFNKQNKGSKYPQPYFITRFGIAFIDLLIVAAITLGMQLLFKNTIFDVFDYSTKVEELREIAKNSGLYVISGTSYVEVDKAYTEAKDRLKEYDPRITYFYTHNDRAIKENKIEEFNNAKIVTNFFDIDSDGNLTPKENIDDSYFIQFYEKQYGLALEYLMADSTYIIDASDTFLIFVLFLLLSISIANIISYLVVPLLSKKKQTLAQMLFKVMVVDYKKDLAMTNKQVVIRFFSIWLFEYIIPVLVFTRIQMLSLLPLLITIASTGFTKKNLAPHEFITGTMSVSYREGVPILEGKPEIDIPDLPPQE